MGNKKPVIILIDRECEKNLMTEAAASTVMIVDNLDTIDKYIDDLAAHLNQLVSTSSDD